jgi:competence protein ComEC
LILLVIAMAWLAGATFGALGYGEWWPAFILGVAGVAFGWAASGQRHRALVLTVAVLACVASLARYEASVPALTSRGIAVYNEGPAVRLLGTVDGEPEERTTSQRLVVDVAAVEVDGAWVEVDGRVLVTERLFPRYAYGDIVDLTAELETPPVFESFDYREYLARRGIISTALFPKTTVLSHSGGDGLKRALIEARQPFGEALEQTLPEPESALAKGILLGQRASIPDDVNDAFNAAGISHLIAISGYNVMLVAGAAIGAMAPLIGRRPATRVAMLLVIGYAIFVGASPSVLRAALMAQVMLGATLVGRPGSAFAGVVLAGALLVAWRPLIIEDVSFQLSFAATLGIVLLATPLREYLASRMPARVPGGVASFVTEQVAVTTAASVAVLPIIASSFGRLSIVSLPANLLATPAFAFALAGSFVTAVAGAIDTTAGRAAAELAYLPLHYLVGLADAASGLPLASVSSGRFGFVEAVATYGAIGLVATLFLRHRVEVPEPAPTASLRPVPIFAIVSFLAAGFVWWGALQPQADHLRVSVLDVGQGDAILIEAPSGTRVLVDGGPSGALLTQALGDVLPASARRLDLMVLTHGQDDHVTGLVEVLERYNVQSVLWNGMPGETAAFGAWAGEVSREALPVTIAQAGQVIDLGDGVYIEVLHPQPSLLEGTEDDLNNNAVVLRLVYGAASFLLTADIEADGEAAILDAGYDVSATVLKVAHHGSDGATTQPFLDAVSPSIAAVSAGQGNPFGHPSPTLRLRLAGIPLLRTDLNGTITFETDGKRLWLEYERGQVELLAAAGLR